MNIQRHYTRYFSPYYGTNSNHRRRKTDSLCIAWGALQEQTIQRVGGKQQIKVDVRIIAATNKQLRKEIEAGQFREDLYHRLAVIPIHLPSLKDHKDDIPELIQHFLELMALEYGEKKKTITPDAITQLQAMPWTGNIRELRNTIERLIILSGPKIDSKTVTDFAVVRYWFLGLEGKRNIAFSETIAIDITTRKVIFGL